MEPVWISSILPVQKYTTTDHVTGLDVPARILLRLALQDIHPKKKVWEHALRIFVGST